MPLAESYGTPFELQPGVGAGRNDDYISGDVVQGPLPAGVGGSLATSAQAAGRDEEARASWAAAAAAEVLVVERVRDSCADRNFSSHPCVGRFIG
eukprot:SAG11_NODE_11386_length_764_cov_0.926316_2_plen_94_part_01